MHSHTYEAIVLRMYDVGEADRFCILFTRERGRLAARANAVRKLTSRMGGSLLPLRHIRLQAKETSAGLLITSATPFAGEPGGFHNLSSFAQAQQGLELLLSFLHEDESLPELFDVTVAFLRSCSERTENVLTAFIFFLLHTLGLLSLEEKMPALSPEEQRFVALATQGKLVHVQDPASQARLTHFCQALLREQLSSPLKSPSVAAML